jgi:hypothetical protein
VSQAGGVLLLEAVGASRLDSALTAGPRGDGSRTPCTSLAKIVLDLAISLALGGDYLADVAVFRGEPGVRGRMASDPNAGQSRRHARRGRSSP